MVSMSDELKERNILKLILIVRFACATLAVGHRIHDFSDPTVIMDLNSGNVFVTCTPARTLGDT
jgi:hypothetical protein